MFRVSNTVRRTKTEDGGVLLDIHHGRMFCLNIVGAKILDLLDKGFETREIAAEVSDAYAMDVETVRADVLDFFEVLNKHHILQGRASGALTERFQLKVKLHQKVGDTRELRKARNPALGRSDPDH
jgi:hypothetical protein